MTNHPSPLLPVFGKQVFFFFIVNFTPAIEVSTKRGRGPLGRARLVMFGGGLRVGNPDLYLCFRPRLSRRLRRYERYLN